MAVRTPRVLIASCLSLVLGAALWWTAAPALQTTRLWLASPRGARADSLPLSDLVAAGAATTAVAAYLLLVGTAMIAVAARLAGPGAEAAVARRGLSGPRWWRSMVLTSCGLGLGMQVAAAQPAPGPVHPGPRCAACAPRLDGLPYPDLPTAHGPTGATPAVRIARPTAETVTVRRGECLWTIAAGLSPPGAADAAVAERVARLYSVNRDVIGPDPDLIQPGTVLDVQEGPQ